RGADAEREGQACGGREAGVAPQHAAGVAQIHDRILYRADAARVAGFLLDSLDAAEIAERGPARRVGRQSLPHAFGDVAGEVVVDLVVHRALDVAAAEEETGAPDETSEVWTHARSHAEPMTSRIAAANVRQAVTSSAS